MKKESKSHKAHYGRFILLTISILLYVNRIFAQCPTTWPLPCACENSLTIDRDCSTSCGTYATDVTAIKKIVQNTDLVSIAALNFPSNVRMFASDFHISSPNNGSFSAATVAELPATFS